jgi:hypothetical protein
MVTTVNVTNVTFTVPNYTQREKKSQEETKYKHEIAAAYGEKVMLDIKIK